nr:DUF4383 domain-containing protein [Kineococcus aurantiacus]
MSPVNAPATAPAAIESANPAEAGGPVTSYARAVGALVLGLGVLGLVPGVVTHYSELGLYSSGANLFGLFRTSVVSASLQVLFGLTVLSVSGSVRQAHKAVVFTALAYLLAGLSGAGLVVNATRSDLVVNVASNWLHLALFAVVLGGAVRARRKHVAQLGVF